MSLNRFERAVHNQCLVAGAAGEQASYTEIAKSIGMDGTRHDRDLVIKALKAILREDHRHEGRPLACVATVRADSGLPGWGFPVQCLELGLFTGGDYRAFVEREWQKLCRYCTTLSIVAGPVTSPSALRTAG